MINKADLKDWLDESARKNYAKKLEECIDDRIKTAAIAGKTTFHISTGMYTREGSRKTKFYDLWYTKELSEENREIVQQRIIKKYSDFGFDIQRSSVDCGWSNNYFALLFKDIDKLITKEETK